MKPKYLFIFIGFQIIFLLVLISIWGCASVKLLSPMALSAETPKDRLLAELAVALKNAEKDSSEYIPKHKNGKPICGCVANRRAWTDAVINELNRGVRDRGAQIADNAPFVIYIDIPKITCDSFPYSMGFLLRFMLLRV